MFCLIFGFASVLWSERKKMSWRGKRKDEDVRASDDDSEAHAPAKKVAKPAESSEESDDIVVCNVSPLLSLIRLSSDFLDGGFCSN